MNADCSRDRPPRERGEPRDRARDPIESDPLLSLASSILEGESIDWDALLPSETGRAPALRQLRTLEAVASFHRTIQRRRPGGAEEEDLRRWGDLEIIEPIGRGSFGIVYHAWDPKLDREVALKILDPRRLWASRQDAEVPGVTRPTQAIEEARLLARLRHPNIVTVFGADEHERRIGFWMELVRGETLWSRIRRDGPLGPGEATSIGHDLLGALAAVHGAKILHRDIKAQNVMRAEGGRIVLMDFGIGKDLADGGARGQGWEFGSALYAAPERLRGQGATVQSDLYSVGVLLYYLLSGRYPAEAPSLAALLAAHYRGERAYLRDRRPDLPRPLGEVIERALSPAPADRFASAGEMDAALTRAAAQAEPMSPAGHVATEIPAGQIATEAPMSRMATASPAGRSATPSPTGRGEAATATAAVRLARTQVWTRRLVLAAALALVAAAALRFASVGRYSVQATFYRSLAHRDVPLAERDPLLADDRLFLELKASRAVFLYVVNRDQSGDLVLLFPDPRSEARNPLARGATHRLPGVIEGKNRDWQFSSAGGPEQLLIIASPVRLAELELDLQELNRPAKPTVPPEALTRSVQGCAEARARGDLEGKAATDEIFLRARVLTPKTETTRGAWIRRLDLGD